MLIPKYIIEIMGWVATAIGIISFMPQAYKVYSTNDTKALSLYKWVLINFSFVLWIIYGANIGATPVMGGNILMLLLGSYIMIKKIMNSKKDKE